MHFKDYFRWRSNVNNDDGIFLETRSENGCGKWHFWSEIEPGFGKPSGTPPPRIPRSTPRANVAGIFRITINTWVLRQWRNRASLRWELDQRLFLCDTRQPEVMPVLPFMCLDANKFVLLSVFTLIKTIYPSVWTKPVRNDANKSHFRLTSVGQKRCCLSSPFFYEGNNGATGFLRLPIKF